VTVAGAEIASSPLQLPPSGRSFDSTTDVAPDDDCQTAAAVPLALIARSGASALRALLEIATGLCQEPPADFEAAKITWLPPTS
jgi:hypothetical protein